MKKAWVLALAVLLVLPVATAGKPPKVVDATDDGVILAGKGDLRPVDAFIADMEAAWADHDAACDSEALFARTYYITSVGVRDAIAAGHFQDNAMVADWDVTFAGYYFDALQTYQAGGTPSRVWEAAFSWGDSGMSLGYEDVLLGMNAHINYDLALATYDAGLPQRGEKADFDAINDVFDSVIVDITTEVGKRYDPALHPTGASPLSDAVVLDMIHQWRANAWDNAVRLAEAPDAAAREDIRQEMEAEALLVAAAFQVPKLPTGPLRVAYCEEYHADPTSHDYLDLLDAGGLLDPVLDPVLDPLGGLL